MITIRDVSFTYAGNETDGIHHINLEIQKGECVLLCGRSGCGKTTVTRLINGLIPSFYMGTLTGSVLIDNQPVGELPLYKIAKRVGSVFQNPRTQFFNVDTDSEIAFGIENEGYPQEQLVQRVRQTAEDLHIETLSERNIFELSGGEKQRIAIARALLKDAPLLLLDEPTASLDARNEVAVQKAIGQLVRNKTVVMIAHRLKTIENADQILVVNEGRIQECGTHRELLERNGLYARLWNLQNRSKEWSLKNIHQ